MSDQDPDQEQGQTEPDQQCEQAVVEYLRDHPDVLVRYPEIASALVVPQEFDAAVSLVEYQRRRLKAENRDLNRRLQALVQNARENQDLGSRIHDLTLSLVECSSVDEMFGRLYQALCDDFRSDFAALRVFAVPRIGDDAGLAEFVTHPAPARELFDAVLSTDRPVCGPLAREQATYLFADHGDEIGSAALIPLGRNNRIGRFGILAICSRDRNRFRAGMGTVFLRQLATTVTHAIELHLVLA